MLERLQTRQRHRIVLLWMKEAAHLLSHDIEQRVVRRKNFRRGSASGGMSSGISVGTLGNLA